MLARDTSQFSRFVAIEGESGKSIYPGDVQQSKDGHGWNTNQHNQRTDSGIRHPLHRGGQCERDEPSSALRCCASASSPSRSGHGLFTPGDPTA